MTTTAAPTTTTTATLFVVGQRLTTVTVWLNTTTDPEGRHLGMVRGYKPEDTLELGISYVTTADDDPVRLAEDAFAAFNGHPNTPDHDDMVEAWYGSRRRSLSVGDVVAVGDRRYSVDSCGWTELAS